MTAGEFETRGQGVYEELLWVHDMIRRDLETVQKLAAEVRKGVLPAQVTETIDRLETEGPLWKLRVNCLYYCRFVHGHHSLEDSHLFPAVRNADPGLDPVVTKLERDHLQVSDQLDEIRRTCDGLGKDDSAENRERLVSALDGMSRYLLDHLTYEEESLRDVLGSMTMDQVLRPPRLG